MDFFDCLVEHLELPIGKDGKVIFCSECGYWCMRPIGNDDYECADCGTVVNIKAEECIA